MSEADQPAGEAAPATEATGIVAEAPATTEAQAEDIDTEAFDRMPAPEGEEDAEAGDGQASADPPEEKPAAAEDPETVEIEVNGKKYAVPKAVEAAVLKDADYTQKTQKLADERRALDAERAQQADSLVQLRDEHVAIATRERELSAISADLAEYAKLTDADWQAIKAQDATAYEQHAANYTDLQRRRAMANDALNTAKTALTTKEASLTAAQNAAFTAKLEGQWKQANDVLATKIEGWNPANQDKFNEIAGFLDKEFGVSKEQAASTPDPIAWIMANRLMKAEARVKTLEAANTQKAAAANTAKALEVVPAAKPAGASPAPRGVKDDLSTEAWMKRREAQIARKRA